ncbi:hypothetical protein V8B97DRAFT_2102188 [Scleroderma yunnanense]
MPGPRGKQNSAKKAKPKSHSSGPSATPSPKRLEFGPLIEAIDSAEDWNTVASLLCNYLELPDLTRRSGLKKVYNNFDVVYKRIDSLYAANASNEKIAGGIVGIYTKMCADAILRNRLFQHGLLSKIMPLIERDGSRRLALRALTTVTHHGGVDIRQEIALQTPTLINVLQRYPDDLESGELAMSTLAHAVGAAVCNEQKPGAKYLRALKIPTLLSLVLEWVTKPGISVLLLHHALELLAQTTLHCWQDWMAYPPAIEFFVACMRSSDLSTRCYALGGSIRLHAMCCEQDQRSHDPKKLIAAAQRDFPDHLKDVMMDYGLPLCDAYLTLRSVGDYQKAMMDCTQDRDFYSLGFKLAELITRNEFSIAEGGFQSLNPRTGKLENIDVGLPFKMWTDALPLCARAIREKHRPTELDTADMLDMKFFIVRSRVSEAVALAKTSIQRNLKFPYFYYVVTLGLDIEEGLRCAKKGLKCPNTTPFIRFGLMHRAVEIAGNLGICRIQESREGVAFLTSSLEDAKAYISQAPPDARHMKNVIYWYICLTIAMKGPEMSEKLSELQPVLRKLADADEFSRVFGIKPPKTQLRLTQEVILKHYSAGIKEWGSVVANFDSVVDHGEHIFSPTSAEDQLALWLADINVDDDEGPGPKVCSHPRITTNTVELYRCSWCGNPSAVLRKCSGCEKARYCDTTCQKSHWSTHKAACNRE